MIHPSDEDLLDLALSGDDADVRDHAASCADCRARLEAVEREQRLITSAFDDVEMPGHLRDAIAPRRGRWIWLAAPAAAILLATTVAFALQAHHWKKEAGRLATEAAAPRPAPEQHRFEPEDGRLKLKNVAHQVSEKRADGQIVEFMQGLDTMRTVVIESMNDAVTLTEEQRHRMDEIVSHLTERMCAGEPTSKLAQEYRAAMKDLLTAEQLAAFEKSAQEEAEWARSDAIDLLAEELAAELDLRHSEQERLREVLDEVYPTPEACAPFLMANPSDPLQDDPKLAAAVRRALDESYLDKFDAYLKELAQQRAEIEKAFKGGK